MSLKTFDQTYLVMVIGGEKRADQTIMRTLILSFLGGCYIAIGGFWALMATSSMSATIWGSLSKLIFAGLFPIGLMLILLTGAELFTGNCMTLSSALYEKKIGIIDVLRNWSLSWLGNFAGAAIFAYTISYMSGLLFISDFNAAQKIVSMANAKVSLSFSEAFLRGIIANWLVCLAVFIAMTSDTLINKVVGLWIPVTAFVTLGAEHSIANMFFVPLGIFAGNDIFYQAQAGMPALQVTWSTFFLHNLVPVTLGNIFGGAVCVSAFYFVLAKNKL